MNSSVALLFLSKIGVWTFQMSNVLSAMLKFLLSCGNRYRRLWLISELSSMASHIDENKIQRFLLVKKKKKKNDMDYLSESHRHA